MFAVIVLFGILPGYLLSFGPVGIRLCHVLCDRDCSCSFLKYEPEQMECSYILNSSAHARWNTRQCTSQSCRALQTKAGTIRCVNKFPLLTSPESEKKLNHVVKVSKFKKQFLSKKGVDTHSLKTIIGMVTYMEILQLTGMVEGQCNVDVSLVYTEYLKKIKILSRRCGKLLLDSQTFIEISDKLYIHFTKLIAALKISFSQPEKTSLPFLSKVIYLPPGEEWYDIKVYTSCGSLVLHVVNEG